MTMLAQLREAFPQIDWYLPYANIVVGPLGNGTQICVTLFTVRGFPDAYLAALARAGAPLWDKGILNSGFPLPTPVAVVKQLQARINEVAALVLSVNEHLGETP